LSLEIATRLDYGYKKVENEHKPLDHMLENLEEVCLKVMDSHIDRLAWKFKPKLILA